MSQESNSPDTAPTVLEYARFHGVAVNHLEFDHFDDLIIESRRALVDLEDPPGASVLTFAPPPSDDNIQCTKEVALFLAEAMRRPKTPPWEELVPKYRKLFDPKLELPLLMTDHDENMRNFGVKEDPDDTIFNLLFAEVDEKQDEGLTWPSWYEGYPNKCMDFIRQEKLDIPKDAWVYLQKTIRMNPADEDVDALFGPCPKFERKRALEPLTPLLLPFEPAPLPYVPSSSALEFPLLSEHTSPLTKEHRKAEEAVANEKLGPPEVTSTGGSSREDMLLDGLRFEGSSLEQPVELPRTPLKRFRTSDLKVDTLLSPPKLVSEAGEDPKILLEDLKDSLKLDAMQIGDDDDEEHHDRLLEISMKANAWVQETLKQERPTGEATKLRADVPPMDFSLPAPPWEASGMKTARADGNTQSPGAIVVAEMNKQSLAKYPCESDPALERKLDWRVFPKEQGKVRVDVRDAFEESSYLTSLLEEIRLSEEIDYNILLPVLQPFRRPHCEESDEDGLQPLDFKVSAHPLGTIPKPHLQPETFHPSTIRPDELRDAQAPPVATDRRIVLLKRPFPQSLQLEPFFSGENMPCRPTPNDPDSRIDPLSTFLRSRGRSLKRLKLTDTKSTFFPKTPPSDLTIDPAPTTPNPGATLPPPKEHQNEITIPSQPALPLPSHPITLIIPLALQKTQRLLLNTLQTLFPPTELIERDYSRSPLRLPSLNTISLPPENEADIVLSPSTAIILTSAPQITQTSLPGRGPAVSPLHTRIAAIASRYERLYVLISTPSSSNTLSMSTCAALSSLTAFCTSVHETSTVSTLLVPSPSPFRTTKDNEPLARHILYLASKHCLSLPATGPGITMLPEETTWEIFLRAVGLNTYAAQVLINLVKAPNNGDGIMELVEAGESAYHSKGKSKSRDWSSSSSSPSQVEAREEKKMYGLQAILHMSPFEREQMFGEVMGGARVLRRVGLRLDGVWGR